MYLHRERSIDDGSRFDPRIDKYDDTSLQRRKARLQKFDESKQEKTSGLGRVMLYTFKTFKHNESNLSFY